jgi:hypothetical protein
LASYFVFQLESTFLRDSKKTRKNVTKLRAITSKYSLIRHPNLVTFASAEIHSVIPENIHTSPKEEIGS